MLSIVVLEKAPESSLDCKEIKPVSPKGNQLWIFLWRIVAEAEAPILWPPDARTNSLEKTLMLGKTDGRRWEGWLRMRCLDGITDWMDMSLSKPRKIVKDKEATKSQTQYSDWAVTRKFVQCPAQGGRPCPFGSPVYTCAFKITYYPLGPHGLC